MPNLYADFYQSASVDGNLARFYAKFTSGAMTPIELLRTMANPLDRHVIAYLGKDHRVHILHRLALHVASLNGPTSAYTGHHCGIVDELNELGPNMAATDANLFAPIVVKKVPTVGEINAERLLHPDDGQLTIAAADAPLAGEVTTQAGVVVPPSHVRSILVAMRSGSITPNGFFDIVGHITDADSGTTGATAFLEWCRVAVASGVGAANPLVASNHTPTPIVVDTSLGRSRAAMIAADFPPALAPGVAPDIIGAIAALGHGSEQRALANEAAAADKAAAAAVLKSSPSRIWPSSMPMLFKVCQAADEATLPPVYSSIARNELKNCLSTLQDAVRAAPFDASLSLPIVGLPTVSIARSQSVSSLHFLDGKEDMDGALSIFGSCYYSQAVVASLNRQNRLYSHHLTGTTAITPAEMREFDRLQKLQLPESWFQLRQILGAYHRWIQLLLGEAHVVPVGFHRLVTALDKMAATSFETQFRGAYPCVQLMYSIQVYTWQWLSNQLDSPVAVTPRYDALIEAIQCQSWVPPKLESLPSPLSDCASLEAGGSSPSAPVPQKTSGQGDPVVAPPEHRLSGVFNSRVSVNNLLKAKPPPRNAANNPFCLNYHVRGACHKDCRYGRDHRMLQADDKAILVAYLAEALPKPPVV